MKQNNKCLKCESSDLIRVPILPGEGPHIAIGEQGMHAMPLAQFVCCTCGYIEVWIEGAENLKKLREYYGRKK